MELGPGPEEGSRGESAGLRLVGYGLALTRTSADRAFRRFLACALACAVLAMGTTAALPAQAVSGAGVVVVGTSSARELAAEPDLGVRPFLVLTHGVGPPGIPAEFETLWSKWQKQVALLSTSSILVRAENASHGIQLDAPALTAAAFRQVIAAVRAGAPLSACTATPLPRVGGRASIPPAPECAELSGADPAAIVRALMRLASS